MSEIKMTKSRAKDLGILVCKDECRDCACCYEAHGELWCEDKKTAISAMEAANEFCPEIDHDKLRENMTKEEYDTFRHNKLDIIE